MGLADRDYLRSSGRGGYRDPPSGAGSSIFNLLNWSFPIGAVAGIRIGVHVTFLILVAFELFSGPDIWWTVRWLTLLFGSVLLHEFGHAFACRAVGGQASEILIWPLGGLAYVSPPCRPWPEFVTTIWGPLVNVILAAGSYLVLAATHGVDIPVGWNPFHPYLARPGSVWGDFLADLFVVNYALLMFNLALIFYPFDGGRIVQVILWTWLGYVRSMRIACTLGMLGAGVVTLVGIGQGSLLLVLIAVMGFMACRQQRRALADVSDYDLGLQPSYDVGRAGGGQRPPGFVARLRETNRARRQQRTQVTRRCQDAEVDRILDKIRREGIGALTDRERLVLDQASHMRRGDS